MITNNSSLPEKTLKLSIGENTYAITFPNNSGFVDITAMKHNLAGGNGLYSSMSISMDDTSQYTALTIDMVATFNILIGDQLKKDLTVKGLMELDMVTTRQLIDVYTEQYLPWYNAWMKIITAPKKSIESTPDPNEGK